MLFSIGESWRPLGMLSNDKPSAVFKLSMKSTSSSSSSNFPSFNSPSGDMEIEIPSDAHNNGSNNLWCHIGISIEPINSIMAQLPAATTTPMSAVVNSSNALVLKQHSNDDATLAVLAKKMVENFMNYMISFSTTAHQISTSSSTASSSASFVPLAKTYEWYDAALKKIKNDPNFVKTMLNNHDQ